MPQAAPTSERYTATAVGLHWLVAALIFAAFGLGMVMTEIPGITPTKLKYYSWHKWLGVTVFALVVVRVLWRVTHPAPPLPESTPAWQARAAHGAHALLYALMVLVPLTGYFGSLAAGYPVVFFGVLPLPVLIGKNEALRDVLVNAHLVLNYAMAAFVVAHLVAALKHQFVDRDGLLARMVPWLKNTGN